MTPTKIYFTKGYGVHKDKLVSFELALRAAGIERFNLVTVSSIFPAKAVIVTDKSYIDNIEAGDLLVDLDKGESQAELEEARSRSQKNAADLERLRLDAVEAERQHRQALTKALAQYEYSAARLTRTRELLAKGLVAGSALEDDQLKDKLAESDLRTLEKRDLATFQRQIEVLQRELEAGEKTITKLEARLRTKEIRAPIAGQILRYEFVPGQMVTPDQVLMEIFGGPMVLKARIPDGRLPANSQRSANKQSWKISSSRWDEPARSPPWLS